MEHQGTLSDASPQRASRACQNCRQRKIKCDLAGRHACTACSSSKRTCDVLRSSSSYVQTCLLPVSAIARRSQLASNEPQMRGRNLRNLDSQPLHRGPLSVPTPPLNDRSLDIPRHEEHHPPSERAIAQTNAPSTVTVDDDVWARNLHEMSHERVENTAETVLAISPQESSSTKSSFLPARKRVRFSGDSLAHPLLPVMDGHAELSSSHEGQAAVQVDRMLLRQVPAPICGQPQGKAPWINADCQAHMDLLRHLPLEDRYYLYNMKRVFKFPQRSVTTELIRAFFRSVYPLHPIVDRHVVADLYERLYTQQQSSPLLLHAMFFCASLHVDELVLREAGFQNSLEARIYFGTRARILYSYDCEPDHLVVVQTLILLSFWWMEYTEEKDMRYWMSCAVNLALTMGMHKTLPKSLNMSSASRRLWRRIFWTLFAREHIVASALGQPFSLQLNSCDLHLLSEADFEEEYNLEQSTLSLPTQTPCHIHVVLKTVELSIQLEKLNFSLNEVRESHEILSRLSKLKDITSPTTVALPVVALEGFSIEDSSTWTTSNVFPVFLRLLHERVVTFFYRRRERALHDISRNTSSDAANNQVPTPLSSETSHSQIDHDLKEVRTQISSSATRVVSLLDRLRTTKLIRYAPSYVNTTSFHALLTLVEEIINNSGAPNHQQHIKAQFNTGLEALREMRHYWSAASWSYALYSDLALHNFVPLKPPLKRKGDRSLLSSRYGSPSFNIEAGLNWDEETLDPMQYLLEGTPYSLDLFGDWQSIVLDSQ